MFEIFDEAKKVKSAVILRLVTDKYRKDMVTLVIVDETGKIVNRGALMSFFEDGTFSRMWCVNSSTGIKRDHIGRIVERD